MTRSLTLRLSCAGRLVLANRANRLAADRVFNVRDGVRLVNIRRSPGPQDHGRPIVDLKDCRRIEVGDR